MKTPYGTYTKMARAMRVGTSYTVGTAVARCALMAAIKRQGYSAETRCTGQFFRVWKLEPRAVAVPIRRHKQCSRYAPMPWSLIVSV